MKITRFCNKGVLDAVSITTFGCSVKDKESAIGFFGTGLKYAIAILVREGIDFHIQSGGITYTFKKEDLDMRGKIFTGIRMYGPGHTSTLLPFTTELGKNWEVWQAFRELYCNCLDENGLSFTGYQQGFDPADWDTIITVYGDSFHYLMQDTSGIVLLPQGLSVAMETSAMTIYYGKVPYTYCQGIRVAEQTHESNLVINYNSVQLTEDRTLRYPTLAEALVSNSIFCDETAPESLLRHCFTANEDTLEGSAWKYNVLSAYSNVAAAVAMRLHKEKLRYNKLCWSVVKEELIKNLTHGEAEPFPPGYADMVTEAKKLLEYVPSFQDDYPIYYCSTLGEYVAGRAVDGYILLSSLAFTQGIERLAAIILEEHLHIAHGYRDYTPEFQNAIFDLLMTEARLLQSAEQKAERLMARSLWARIWNKEV